MSSEVDPEKAMDVAEPEFVDYVEDEEEDMAESDQKKLSSQLLKNPEVLAALQGKLGSIVGTPSGYIQALPAPVKRRIKALKKYQLEATKIEAEFYKELHLLECKYHTSYLPFHEKRKAILLGQYEPTDEESLWPSDDEKDEDELAEELKQKAKLETDKKGEIHDMDENTKGIPEFWLTVFKNVEMLAEMVQDNDEPILRHLEDITLKLLESDPMGFVLEFHFSANDYFSNTFLTKHYEMKCSPDEQDPFSFEGPEIFKCKGCTIDWKKGKNVTVKVIKKKQKHKSRGAVRTVTKTVQNDSFFNFFNPPSVPDDPEAELDEDTQAILTADFEIGHYFRERIIPRAVLYFTGEALEEDDFEEEEGEEGEEGEDEDEDEEDPDYDPKKDKKAENPAECKQQ